MAKEGFKVIPVAERIIEFGTKDIRKNDYIIWPDELISEKEWNEFAENALVIVDGWHIVQYAEEYPIVRYKCDESASCCYLGPDFRLNAFIESITVSTACYGKKAWFGSGKLSCENTDYDTVVYYTDHAGINHAIIQHDICWFLLQKPNLVVSPEGVLVFFTDKQIIATVDCNNSYHWIDGYVIDVESKTIKDIEVCDDYCKVILLDDNKAELCFSLNFDMDAISYQTLNPKASKM